MKYGDICDVVGMGWAGWERIVSNCPARTDEDLNGFLFWHIFCILYEFQPWCGT